jgi:hypothetical protein
MLWIGIVYPDQEPNIRVDADPDTDYHQNYAESYADPTPVLHVLEKYIRIFLILFLQQCQFLISGEGVLSLSI